MLKPDQYLCQSDENFIFKKRQSMKDGDHQSSEFTMTGPLSKTQTDRPRPSGDK